MEDTSLLKEKLAIKEELIEELKSMISSTSELVLLKQSVIDKINSSVIKLSAAEIQSGVSRVKFAEGLIEQLPADHEGRNTWLINYGVKEEAKRLREENRIGRLNRHDNKVVRWDDETMSLESKS